MQDYLKQCCQNTEHETDDVEQAFQHSHVITLSSTVHIFGEDKFFHAAVDVVHHSHPGKLIPGFQFFRYTLPFCRFRDKYFFRPGAALIHFDQMIVELFCGDQ